ncbi:MAG: hypothetical protein ABEH90_11290 [Halolamina sp.]
MVAEDTRPVEPDSPSDGGSPPRITAVRCSPERTVFTEDDNDDGWISTDTTVDVEQ